jgi:hypothetical protein
MADEMMDFASELTEVNDEQQVTEQVDNDVEQVEEHEESGSPDSESNEGDEKGASQKYSGRAIGDAVKAAAAQFPEQAQLFKKLQDAYFRNQTFEKAFPSAAEAQSVKQLLDDVGGVEAIASIQEKVTAYDAQDVAFGEGNPQVLESFFADFPDGAAKLAPAYLDKLSTANPKAYHDTVMPHIAGFLVNDKVWGNYNLPQFIDVMSKETNPENLAGAVAEIRNWITKVYGTGTELYKNQTQSVKQPVDAKLTEREQALNTRELEIKKSTMNETFNTSIEPVLKGELTKYAKQFKLNETQTNFFKKELQMVIHNEMVADKAYQKQLEIRINSKNSTPQTLAQFAANEYNRRVRDNAFKVVKDIYGSGRNTTSKVTDVVKNTQPTTSVGGGPLKINYKPADSDIDWNKQGVDAMSLFIGQKAYLKNGKFVTWKR